jgi:thiamine pyrophosphate-dependent acetolactate synthase large subunit-like protein
MPSTSRRESDAAWVARCIVAALRWSSTSLTRDQLTEQVLEHATGALGVFWQRTTAARRVRDALALLLEGDQPVISAGHGYVLAALATREERERAAQLAERAGVHLLAKARKIRAAVLPHEAVQLELPLAAGGGAR